MLGSSFCLSLPFFVPVSTTSMDFASLTFTHCLDTIDISPGTCNNVEILIKKRNLTYPMLLIFKPQSTDYLAILATCCNALTTRLTIFINLTDVIKLNSINQHLTFACKDSNQPADNLPYLI